MADHALAGRNAVGEHVLDRVTRFILGDRRIDELDPVVFLGCGKTTVTVLGEGARRHWRSVVGIDHVAGAATAGSVVTGMVVGAQEVQGWVQKTSLLQTDHDRVGTILGT